MTSLITYQLLLSFLKYKQLKFTYEPLLDFYLATLVFDKIMLFQSVYFNNSLYVSYVQKHITYLQF